MSISLYVEKNRREVLLEPKKRKVPRVPVLKNISKSATLYFDPPLIQKPIDILIYELSATGMKIESPVPIPRNFHFKLKLNILDDENPVDITAHLIWMRKIRTKYLFGIEFIKTEPKFQETIEKMSYDFNDCESRIKNNTKPICENCSYYKYCDKPQRHADTENIEVRSNRQDARF